MFKSQYGLTVTVVLAVVMGLMMSFVAIWIDSLALNISVVFKNWSMITLVILLVSMFVPYQKWWAGFASLFHLKEGSTAFKMTANLVPTLILNTFIAVIVPAANILYNEAVPAQMQLSVLWASVVRDWPLMLVISYFVSFVAEAAGKAVASRYVEA